MVKEAPQNFDYENYYKKSEENLMNFEKQKGKKAEFGTMPNFVKSDLMKKSFEPSETTKNYVVLNQR